MRRKRKEGWRRGLGRLLIRAWTIVGGGNIMVVVVRPWMKHDVLME